jgi:hypothetical protein
MKAAIRQQKQRLPRLKSTEFARKDQRMKGQKGVFHAHDVEILQL